MKREAGVTQLTLPLYRHNLHVRTSSLRCPPTTYTPPVHTTCPHVLQHCTYFKALIGLTTHSQIHRTRVKSVRPGQVHTNFRMEHAQIRNPYAVAAINVKKLWGGGGVHKLHTSCRPRLHTKSSRHTQRIQC